MLTRTLAVVVHLAGALLLGCSPASSGQRGAAAPTVSAAATATIIEQSHAFVLAFGMADEEAVAKLAGPGFVKIEASRFMERERMLKRFAAHQAAAYPRIVDRTWDGEKVRFAGDGTAIFTAFTTSKLVRAEGAEPVETHRFVTLVWVAGEAGWQLALMQVADAGVEAERQFWNEVYRAGSGFNTKPNRFLMETVRGRPPGRALDVAMGQGRNAVFLAAAGWQVTGVDISEEALRQAQETAKQEGLTITTVLHDVDTWDFGTEQWDLICFIYAGGGRGTVERVKKSLKPGGIVVVEFFLAESVKDIGISGFEPNELPTLYQSGFKVLHYEEVDDTPDWGPNKAKLVRFVAQKL